MSHDLTVSIVIVSRHRPEALRRCLIGISQLRYGAFEVVVVADPTSCTAMRALPQAAHAKVIPFDEANISAARNQGIAIAAGEIIAFIDDDAVPEPTWLDFLIAPFAQADVMAAGGFVRGRNGISWQSRAGTVDQTGVVTPLEVDKEQATVLTPTRQQAIKTEGTNMAVRRACLAEMGGFDPRFRFFLDETDLNMRLAALGKCTAIAPCAQVHHGFAASTRRRADRVPVDLFEIGASWAVFLAKHCDQASQKQAWARATAEQRKRLLSHMVTGALEPRDVSYLMKTLARGFCDGQQRLENPLACLQDSTKEFRPYPGKKARMSHLITGRVWSRSDLRRRARAEAISGSVVTVIRLSPTALFHRVTYRDDGYWEQIGGLYGKSDRANPLFRLWTFRRRLEAEVNRIRKVRGLTQ